MYALSKDTRIIEFRTTETYIQADSMLSEHIYEHDIIGTIPYPMQCKTAFMLCMRHIPCMRGRYIPTDVYTVIFSFLRICIRRVGIGVGISNSDDRL